MELEFPLLEGKMPRDDDDCPTEDNSSTDEDGFSKVPSDDEDELNSASQLIHAGFARSTSEQEERKRRSARIVNAQRTSAGSVIPGN
jgi:hypothetical protein